MPHQRAILLLTALRLDKFHKQLHLALIVETTHPIKVIGYSHNNKISTNRVGMNQMKSSPTPIQLHSALRGIGLTFKLR